MPNIPSKDSHLAKPTFNIKVEKIITVVLPIKANSIEEALDTVQKMPAHTRLTNTQGISWRASSISDPTKTRDITPQRY